MPKFGSLGPTLLHQLAVFLSASKGRSKAGAVAPLLGVTGASGAPYALRLLEALAAAGCEVGVCASSAGVEVLATELYGEARSRATRRSRASPSARGKPRRSTTRTNWRAPYASGRPR
jgi:3-polyprenyl-4-hydroxybenzoate decarboxylase